jgi:diguanylate cyclase (GGDEF)-like protein
LPAGRASIPDRVRRVEEHFARHWGDYPGLESLGVRTCGFSPIISPQEKLAGLFVMHYSGAVPVEPSDRDLMETASRLAAVAVEQRRLTDRLAHMAQHDALTGLPNRRFLKEWLPLALAEAQERVQCLAIVFVDLDRFKQINDNYGHSAGDLLIEQVGRRLRGSLREEDVLARMGGDEFVAVLTCLMQPDHATLIARRLLDSLRLPFRLEGHEVYMTASVGVSIFPQDGDNPSDLLTNADGAMYRVKSSGRNGLECFTAQRNAAGRRRGIIESRLRTALSAGAFQVSYQPQVDFTGSLNSLEVLLSWEDPELGKVPPEHFIAVAEESGLIVPLGAWVLRHACRQAAEWMRKGFPPVHLAVNVSGVQFARDDFVDLVAEALQMSQMDPHCLELELTESVIMSDFEVSARRIGRLRALGVRTAIDDFGAGYSSLAYLRRLPVDGLKIDRSFVHDLETAAPSLSLVRTIVSLAHEMGFTVVAEGVETVRQFELLRDAGCDKAQGHLFGTPLSAADVEKVLGVAAEGVCPLNPAAGQKVDVST